MSIIFNQKVKTIKYNIHDDVDSLDYLEHYRESLLEDVHRQKSCPYNESRSEDLIKYYRCLFSMSLSLKDVEDRIEKLKNN